MTFRFVLAPGACKNVQTTCGLYWISATCSHVRPEEEENEAINMP